MGNALVRTAGELLVLENDALSATIAPNRGADVLALRDRRSDTDLLWTTPWAERAAGPALPGADTMAGWMEGCRGGWQVLFPNGGAACRYLGAEHPFHGEACQVPWSWSIVSEGGERAELELSVRLVRGPFLISRTMWLERASACVWLRERIANVGGEPHHYIWGHHPGFGAPLVAPGSRIHAPARRIVADDAYDGPHNPLRPGETYGWPVAHGPGGDLDLSLMPDDDAPRHMLGYLQDFDAGWFAVTNSRLRLGVGMTWPLEVMPHAWLWQELRASSGYPWYRQVYALAVEPNTSVPGQGLATAVERGSARLLAPGEHAEVTVGMVVFHARGDVLGIDRDGTVRQAEP